MRSLAFSPAEPALTVQLATAVASEANPQQNFRGLRLTGSVDASGISDGEPSVKCDVTGIGMRKQGTSSDDWIDEFHFWLEARGFTKPAAR